MFVGVAGAKSRDTPLSNPGRWLARSCLWCLQASVESTSARAARADCHAVQHFPVDHDHDCCRAAFRNIASASFSATMRLLPADDGHFCVSYLKLSALEETKAFFTMSCGTKRFTSSRTVRSVMTSESNFLNSVSNSMVM
jgi:hypothetical protein